MAATPQLRSPPVRSTVFLVLCLTGSAVLAQQAPAIVDPQSGGTITVVPGSHVYKRMSKLGEGWIAHVQLADKSRLVISRVPVGVSGCVAGPLGPLGNMISVNGVLPTSGIVAAT